MKKIPLHPFPSKPDKIQGGIRKNMSHAKSAKKIA